ncbi:MAG: hypothetical protein LIP01_05145 [Tannerellaceae bacterium]|nr:hypothetical protein [Tannerellaceae bacterium]
MSEKDDFLQYDEDDSAKFIQNYLPQELKGKFSDDDILYIVDLIADFYDVKGVWDEETENKVVEIDEDELIEYVITKVQKEGLIKFTKEEVTFIIQGEMEYCDSINMFD